MGAATGGMLRKAVAHRPLLGMLAIDLAVFRLPRLKAPKLS